MANTYVSVDTLKDSAVLDVSGTADDARLLVLAEAMSRAIDRHCNRHLYVLSATRSFDAAGGDTLALPDLISIDSGGLKTDDDLDRSFETTWVSTDYLLYPLNADPGSSGNPQSRPYSRIVVDVAAGTKSAFPSGRQVVQVAGQWGYRRHVRRAAETADAIADGATTAVGVSSRTDVEAGHTLLIDSEQMFVRSYSGNNLTVDRGVNGTTAASHSAATVIDVYRYPEPVSEAAIIEVARQWRRKDGGFGSLSGLPGRGPADATPGLDPDARRLLAPFRRPALG